MGEHALPSKYQLQADPSLHVVPAAPFHPSTVGPDGYGGYHGGGSDVGPYSGITSLVNEHFGADIFPHPIPKEKAPGADIGAWPGYVEPSDASAFQLPSLPWGMQGDKDGIGGSLGDWALRFLPIIPGLTDPDQPDLEKSKKAHEIFNPLVGAF